MVEVGELSLFDKFAQEVTKCLNIFCVAPLPPPLTLPLQGEDQPVFTTASASEENDEEYLLSAEAPQSPSPSRPRPPATSAAAAGAATATATSAVSTSGPSSEMLLRKLVSASAILMLVGHMILAERAHTTSELSNKTRLLWGRV